VLLQVFSENRENPERNCRYRQKNDEKMANLNYL
jgi:hypothetical protein